MLKETTIAIHAIVGPFHNPTKPKSALKASTPAIIIPIGQLAMAVTIVPSFIRPTAQIALPEIAAIISKKAKTQKIGHVP
jgi:hypothetical protein